MTIPRFCKFAVGGLIADSGTQEQNMAWKIPAISKVAFLPKAKWLRNRMVAVYVVLGTAWAGSLIVALGVFRVFEAEPWQAFRHEVFAAWCGELLFFTIIGVLVAIITLRDPTTETFEERLRILYGAKIPDAVMAYNRNQISKLAAFYRRGARTVIIDD